MKKPRRQRQNSFDLGRLLASMAISFGLLALVLSFYNPISGASEPGPQSSSEPQFQADSLPELFEQEEPSQLRPASNTKQLSAESQVSTPKATPSPRSEPLPRTAAPIDALPASKVKAVSSGSTTKSSSGSSSSAALYTGPLSVSLVALDGTAAGGVAERVSSILGQSGRAQTAAVLLELSHREDLNLDDTAEAISEAINTYLDANDRALRQARARTSLIWPAIGPITSYFGPAHPLGIDIGEMEGNIFAALDGKVLFAGGDPCCSYGLYVVMDNGNGLNTVYGHLSSLSVRTGQTVRQGQVLGPVGCSGHCSGNHLHFELWKNGVRIDPMLYLP